MPGRMKNEPGKSKGFQRKLFVDQEIIIGRFVPQPVKAFVRKIAPLIGGFSPFFKQSPSLL